MIKPENTKLVLMFIPPFSNRISLPSLLPSCCQVIYNSRKANGSINNAQMSRILLLCSSGRCYGNHSSALPEFLEEVDHNGNEQVHVNKEQSCFAHQRRRSEVV